MQHLPHYQGILTHWYLQSTDRPRPVDPQYPLSSRPAGTELSGDQKSPRTDAQRKPIGHWGVAQSRGIAGAMEGWAVEGGRGVRRGDGAAVLPKDINTTCLDFNYQVKAIIMATTF